MIMELLQKLTLYDLLGYALPGGMFLIICNISKMDELSNISGTVLILFFVMAFLAGIMISEVSWGMNRIIDRLTEDRQWNEISQRYALTKDKIDNALVNANYIKAEDGVNDSASKDVDYVKRYMPVMFADIQCDPKYSRIHNYASALLLYKNMVVVSAACAIVGISRHSFYEIIIGVVGVLCFFSRSSRFNRKKIVYTICWFLEKYGEEEEIPNPPEPSQ